MSDGVLRESTLTRIRSAGLPEAETIEWAERNAELAARNGFFISELVDALCQLWIVTR